MSTGESRKAPRGLVHSRRAAVLMLLGFLATEMPRPYPAVALVALVPAAFESVRAIRLLNHDGAPRATTLWSGVGLVLVVGLSAVVALSAGAYAFNRDFRECMQGANTHAAVADCRQQGGTGPLSDFLLSG
jgi:hypothetical protein